MHNLRDFGLSLWSLDHDEYTMVCVRTGRSYRLRDESQRNYGTGAAVTKDPKYSRQPLAGKISDEGLWHDLTPRFHERDALATAIKGLQSPFAIVIRRYQRIWVYKRSSFSSDLDRKLPRQVRPVGSVVEPSSDACAACEAGRKRKLRTFVRLCRNSRFP